jgi:hypothetical protein
MLRIHSSPARALASSQRPTWPSTTCAEHYGTSGTNSPYGIRS